MSPTIPGIRFQRLLGEGACGQVFHGIRQDGRPCAVKILEPEAINREYLSYCINKILALPPHPRLVPIFDYHPDDIDGPPYYEMALRVERSGKGSSAVQRGRTLERHCGKTSPATAWGWLLEIAEGVAYLHTHAIVHCNLKPSNVFLTEAKEQHAQVADFGQGWIGGVDALALSDHIFYAPPEQLQEPHHIQFGTGERWDVYAFGVLAYHLLTGHFPRGDGFRSRLDDPEQFGEMPDPDEFARLVISEDEVTWSDAGGDAAESRRRGIVLKCLELDPLERWVDLREVRDALGAVDRDLAERERWEKLTAENARLAGELELARAATGVVESERTAEGKPSPRRRPWLATTLAGLSATAALILGGALLNEQGRVRRLAAERESKSGVLEENVAEQREALAAREAELTQARESARQAAESERIMRENVASAETAAEHFFGSFLEAARQIPPSADQERARLMVSGYNYFTTFLEKNAARPEMAETSLRARCHLAEIKLAMNGGAEAADRFDDARTRIDQWLAQHPGHPREAEFHLLSADCALRAAKARLTANPASTEARDTLRQALGRLSELVRRDASSASLRRRKAETQLLLARTLRTSSGSDDAECLRLLNESADLFSELMTDQKSAQASDRSHLARVYFERGRLERARNDKEAALASQVQSAELLVDGGNDPEDLFLLAQCYGETGEMLDSGAEHRDAARAHAEAVKLLTELVKKLPHRADFHFALATRYADIAHLVREHSEPARAFDYQRGTVEILRALVERNPGNATFATHLARRKADLSDLLTTLGRKPEALVQAREAIALLDTLGPPGQAAGDIDYSLTLNVAQSYGVVGHVAEEAKQPTEAAACFSKAVSHYEHLAAARPGANEVIERGLTWSRMRLAKLKN